MKLEEYFKSVTKEEREKNISQIYKKCMVVINKNVGVGNDERNICPTKHREKG